MEYYEQLISFYNNNLRQIDNLMDNNTNILNSIIRNQLHNPYHSTGFQQRNNYSRRRQSFAGLAQYNRNNTLIHQPRIHNTTPNIINNLNNNNTQDDRNNLNNNNTRDVRNNLNNNNTRDVRNNLNNNNQNRIIYINRRPYANEHENNSLNLPHQLEEEIITLLVNSMSLEPVIVFPSPAQIDFATKTFKFCDINQPLNISCPITLESFTENSMVTMIKHCGHIFTSSEINTWFLSNCKCPICRYDIRDFTITSTDNSINLI